MRGKSRDSSLQERASHTYTLRLGQSRNSILYQKKKKKKKKIKSLLFDPSPFLFINFLTLQSPMREREREMVSLFYFVTMKIIQLSCIILVLKKLRIFKIQGCQTYSAMLSFMWRAQFHQKVEMCFSVIVLELLIICIT